MINLLPIIERITVLLDKDTDQSVTFAALEARLALEKVCYDRLRQRHDYISHAQLQKWQPGAVINVLMAEVDPHVAETITVSIGKNPGVNPEDDDFVEVGKQIGFIPKRIAEMWNALAKLALHIGLHKHKDDHIPDYGDKAKIRKKVEEVLAELERLSKGTMSFPGIGEEVSFICSCGETNRRRSELLRDGQHIRCINYGCKETWKAIKEVDGFWFEQMAVTVNCEKCGTPNQFPWRPVLDMKYGEVLSAPCHSCQHRNYVQWRLKAVRPTEEG